MAADLTIVQMGNTDRRFYPLMGPFLARRQVQREMGGRLWDDDGVWWFLAVRGDGAVAGFCAAHPGGRRVRFRSAYVRPDLRRQGIYRRLFTTRLHMYADAAIRATCTDASLPMFLTHGFVELRRRGRFMEVTRD